MAASRLPGKPLKYILGKTMLEHVYERSNMFSKWNKLFIAGCDKEIKNFCLGKNYPYLNTSKKHNTSISSPLKTSMRFLYDISEL